MMRRSFDPFEPKATKSRTIPFDFVLDQLSPLDPYTKPMFGCTGVYVGDRIFFILRERGDSDDGVWLAYDPENEAQVLELFPALMSIDVFVNKVRGWKKLSVKHPDFEEDVLRACELVRKGDARVGKVPGAKKKSSATSKVAARKKTPARAKKTPGKAKPKAAAKKTPRAKR